MMYSKNNFNSYKNLPCDKLLLEGTVTVDVDFNKRKISVLTNHAIYVHNAG